MATVRGVAGLGAEGAAAVGAPAGEEDSQVGLAGARGPCRTISTPPVLNTVPGYGAKGRRVGDGARGGAVVAAAAVLVVVLVAAETAAAVGGVQRRTR